MKGQDAKQAASELRRNSMSSSKAVACAVTLALILTFGFSARSLGSTAITCQAVFSETSSWTPESALSAISADQALSWRLRFFASRQLHSGLPFKLKAQHALLPETVSALEYLLTQPDFQPDDFRFRKRLFREIAASLPITKAEELLMPYARAVRSVYPEDLFFAHVALRDLGLRFGSSSHRYTSVRARIDAKDILVHEPIVSIRNLGGGWNETKVVTFANGQRAVFKPFFGQRNIRGPQGWSTRLAFTREVTAVPIIEDFLGNRRSRESGVSSVVVPETVEVILAHQGKSYGLGSLQAFKDGFETAGPLRKTNPARWTELTEDPLWVPLEARIRTIDFILGNPDRFENPGFSVEHYKLANLNNLLIGQVERSGIEVALIDNALGRPGKPEFDIKYLPSADKIPVDLAEAVKEFDFEKFQTEFANQLPGFGIADLMNRVRIVQEHLGRGRSHE